MSTVPSSWRNPHVKWVVPVLLLLLVEVLTMVFPAHAPKTASTTLTKVEYAITHHEVARATLDDNDWQIAVTLKAHDVTTTGPLKKVTTLTSGYPDPLAPTLTKELSRAGVPTTVVPLLSSPWWRSLVESLLPVILVMGLALYLIRTQGQNVKRFSAGRSDAVSVPATRFRDVAGATEAVAELSELVEIVRDPARFAAAGARVPKGVLLVGPPGTGKTLMARALAGEAGVAFFSLSGSDFVEAYVGVGAARVRQIFAKARKLSRAIIFIDEIDAVGKSRLDGRSSGATEERENTLNQLLVEMDGFDASGIIVLGATNRPDVLDKALTRAGRFDRRIVVPLPDRRGREKILELVTRNVQLDDTVDLAALAKRTSGLSGADLEYLVNEAALEAVRHDRTRVSGVDLARALETNQIGKARLSAVLTAQDRRVIAWHEAGHATVALASPLLPDPVTVSVIPRGAAGGATWTEESDNTLVTRDETLAQLSYLLGGRAAELLLLDGNVTQGSSNDLKEATRLATEYVTLFGMSTLGLAVTTSSDDLTAHAVHDEVNRLLAQAQEAARVTLRAHLDLLGRVVSALLDEDTIDAPQIQHVKAGRSTDGTQPFVVAPDVQATLDEITTTLA